METAEMSWLDYFSGGVPTAEFFQITLKEVQGISEKDDSEQSGINRLQELCFIGLVSYFEAFCKDHFASLINIEPNLVVNLKASGQDVDIDTTRVIVYGDLLKHRIGFLLAEKYDFGCSKKINGLFLGLLKVIPFSKTEMKQYDELLRDRNLLVHHGGVFTFAYLEQASHPAGDIHSDAFTNSRVIGRAEVGAAIEFIGTIAKKMVQGTHTALVNYLATNGIQYSGERKKALELMTWPHETEIKSAKE